MDNNDTHDNLQKAPEFTPQPILTPASVAITPVFTEPDPTATDTDTNTDTEAPSGSRKKRKFVILFSAAVILLAGIVTVTVLVLTGVLFKSKAKAEEGEGKAEFFHSPEELSDQVTADMDSAAEQFFRKELKDTNPDQADKITIDAFHYVGMVYLEAVRSGESVDSFIERVYQVQVTDNSGEEAIKRQFFYPVGFDLSPVGDKFLAMGHMSVPSFLFFDNWYVNNGFLDAEMIAQDLSLTFAVRSNTVDKNLYLPFDGKDPSEFENHDLIRSVDEITDGMIEGTKKGIAPFLDNFKKTFPDKTRFISAEYTGMGVFYDPDNNQNKAVIAYKIDYVDENTTPEENKILYWYVWFENSFYQGGQIRVKGANCDRDTDNAFEWLLEPRSTIAALRTRLRMNSGADIWEHREYSDNFPDDGSGKKTTTETTTEKSA